MTESQYSSVWLEKDLFVTIIKKDVIMYIVVDPLVNLHMRSYQSYFMKWLRLHFCFHLVFFSVDTMYYTIFLSLICLAGV